MPSSLVDNTSTPRNYRSGEAARLARMPVARLRLWERRYEVVGPAKSEAGQRLYSEGDVRRLVLINALVQRGHAIGAIARLEREQLEFLADGEPSSGRSHPTIASPAVRFRLTLVGQNLARRLVEAGIDTWRYGIGTVSEYTDFSATRECTTFGGKEANLLLLRVPSLHEDAASEVLALSDACGAAAVAVVYGFGTGRATESLRLAGVRLYREPDSWTELRQMLGDLCQSAQLARDAGEAPSWSRSPRRYGDLELEAIAARSSTIACECPRHLAELVMQLSTFESYSDECTWRSAHDLALHRHLGDVANRARFLIESALERVVREEGWSSQADEKE
ncbi:MerR family transcriptional regulator [Paraburkholderia bryophila]|uniref:MerR family transcriptional regulator n=1 Tax=Paraburkholderia bryophila TaxID=420952 RepID=UPI00234B38F8|nr:MerR family transcriptional regulator [Paraburkholderia bryophila]WCM18292.1 MerR family transcriptional regulator [Paraburkholderia bryophila]